MKIVNLRIYHMLVIFDVMINHCIHRQVNIVKYFF